MAADWGVRLDEGAVSVGLRDEILRSRLPLQTHIQSTHPRFVGRAL